MTQLGQRSGAALRYLWTFSLLDGHPVAGPALDVDRMSLDVERLLDTDWAWSSGEEVLLALAEGIATGHGGPLVAELATLDTHHRQVALEALRIWLCGDHETVIV